MKVKDAIECLSQMDQEAEFSWHDAIEGNDCPVNSFFYFKKDNRVFVSPCTLEMIAESFSGDVMIVSKEK